MALYCAPQPALFLDRSRRRVGNRGHRQDQASVVTLGNRAATHSQREKSANECSTWAAAELRSTWTLRLRSGQAPKPPVPTRGHARHYIACFSKDSLKEQAKKRRIRPLRRRWRCAG